MSQVVGDCTRRAIMVHGCFLCTTPIQKGTTYRRWGWVAEGTVRTMKTHLDCCRYASDNLDAWTEGVEENAVEIDVEEALDGDTHRAAALIRDYPEMAPMIQRIMLKSPHTQADRGA